MGLPAALANAQLGVGALVDASDNVLGTAANPFRVAFGSPSLISAVAAGTAVTAASETSLLPAAAKLSLGAGFFKVGTKLRITASGLISSAITTPGTARFKVKLGPTSTIAVFDGLAVLLDTAAAHTAKPWRLTIDLLCITVGASTSATLWGDGEFKSENIVGQVTMPVAAQIAMLPWNASSAAGTGFDSTVANVLDLTFTQTVATGSCTLEQYSVEQVA
jgi:hypothetical protein